MAAPVCSYRAINKVKEVQNPKTLLAEIEKIGYKPDDQALTRAFQNARNAFGNCNNDPSNCYNDDAVLDFYNWESVLRALLEKGAKITPEAKGHAHMIGRGWPKKLEDAEGSCTVM